MVDPLDQAQPLIMLNMPARPTWPVRVDRVTAQIITFAHGGGIGRGAGVGFYLRVAFAHRGQKGMSSRDGVVWVDLDKFSQLAERPQPGCALCLVCVCMVCVCA